jgi:hypothetical protein
VNKFGTWRNTTTIINNRMKMESRDNKNQGILEYNGSASVIFAGMA